jgi:hypothetical protein
MICMRPCRARGDLETRTLIDRAIERCSAVSCLAVGPLRARHSKPVSRGIAQRRAYGLRDEEYLRLKILACRLSNAPKL